MATTKKFVAHLYWAKEHGFQLFMSPWGMSGYTLVGPVELEVPVPSEADLRAALVARLEEEKKRAEGIASKVTREINELMQPT